MKISRNIIFLIIGIIYFYLYYFFDGVDIKSYFLSNFSSGEIILSYITGIVGFILVFGFIGILKHVAKYFSYKKFTSINDIFFLDLLFGFISLTKYFLALYTFSYFAILPGFFEIYLNKFYSIAVIIILVYYVTKFINGFFLQNLEKKSKIKTHSKTLLPFLNKIIVIFIWVIAFITIFDNLGYNIAALLAGAGIGGLAIAFAAQKSISNVFGALTILLNKPFKIGDYVTINGVNGTVKDLGLSYITIIDRMGHQVMIPNESIISTNIENFSIRTNRRADFSIGVVYGTSLAKMQEGVKIIEDILEAYKLENTIESYRVNFEMFDAFSLNIQVTYFSLINDDYVLFLKQKENINLEIKKLFLKAKIDMAFPTQELIIKKEI
ncbi:MAG: mechanosensitive ion channel family protein [Candidatus Gracilibacteria bacterium]|nr:mechanosensitive ion channel family protein [Candidatus Gracilibacteria bacterium]